MGLYLIDNYPRPCYTLADFVDRNYALGKVLSHISDSLKSAMAIPGKSIVKVVVENSGIISITEIFNNELTFSIDLCCKISDIDFIIDGIRVFFDNALYNLSYDEEHLDSYFGFKFAI